MKCYTVGLLTVALSGSLCAAAHAQQSDVSAAAQAATRASSRAAAQAASDAAARASADAATRAAADASTRAAADAATRAAADASTRAAADAAAQTASRTATQAAADAAVRASTDAATQAATDASNRAATDAASRAALGASSRAAVNASTRAAQNASARTAGQARGRAAMAAGLSRQPAETLANGRAGLSATTRAAGQTSARGVGFANRSSIADLFRFDGGPDFLPDAAGRSQVSGSTAADIGTSANADAELSVQTTAETESDAANISVGGQASGRGAVQTPARGAPARANAELRLQAALARVDHMRDVAIDRNDEALLERADQLELRLRAHFEQVMANLSTAGRPDEPRPTGRADAAAAAQVNAEAGADAENSAGPGRRGLRFFGGARTETRADSDGAEASFGTGLFGSLRSTQGDNETDAAAAAGSQTDVSADVQP